MNPAIFLVIESNNKKGSVLEEEAILTCTMWRMLGGKYKDIPIYCLCPTKKIPSKNTISKLKNLGVIYIENYLAGTDELTPVWNKPFGCKWLEQYVKEDQLVCFDMDTYLIKEPPDSFFICPDEYMGKVNVYPGYSKDDKTIKLQGNLLCSERKNGFFSYWWDTVEKLIATTPEDKKWVLDEKVLSDFYNNKEIKIVPLFDVQIDENFEEAFKDKNYNKFFFLHRHLWKENIDTVDRVRNMAIKYYIRTKHDITS